MTCALDGGRHFEDREAATAAVAKQSDCQGKRCACHARPTATPAGRAATLTMPPCPQPVHCTPCRARSMLRP